MGYRFVRMLGSGLAEVTTPQGRTIRVAVPSGSNFRSGQEVTPTYSDRCCCPTGLVLPTPGSNQLKPFKDVLQPRRVNTTRLVVDVPVKPILVTMAREIAKVGLTLEEADKLEPIIKIYTHPYVDRDYCPSVYKDGYLIGTHLKVISTTKLGETKVEYKLIQLSPIYYPLPNRLYYLEQGSFGSAYGKISGRYGWKFAWEPPSILLAYGHSSNIYLTPEGYILFKGEDDLNYYTDKQGKDQLFESTPITLIDFADDSHLANNTYVSETFIIDTEGFDPNNILDSGVENLTAQQVISVMAPSQYKFKSPTTEPISDVDAIVSYATLTYDHI